MNKCHIIGQEVHVALNIDLETEWLEPVSEEQYRG